MYACMLLINVGHVTFIVKIRSLCALLIELSHESTTGFLDTICHILIICQCIRYCVRCI